MVMNQGYHAHRVRGVRTALLIAAGLVLLSLWHLGTLQTHNRLIQALHTAAHFPLFGAITAVIFALLRLNVRGAAGRGIGTYLAAFGIMIAVSLATEGLQTQLEDRYGSLRDVGVNLLGAMTVLALLALHEMHMDRRPRALLWMVAVTATAMVILPVAVLGSAYAKRALDFPVLVRFNLPLDLLHVVAADAQTRRAALPPPYREPDDSSSLCVTLGNAQYPGITFPDPVADWRGHLALELDLTNLDPYPLSLGLRIDDRSHDGRHHDRFNYRIEMLGNSRNRVRIPLSLIHNAPEGRSMELDQIARILLFASAEDQGRKFCLSWVRLVPLQDQVGPKDFRRSASDPRRQP